MLFLHILETFLTESNNRFLEVNTGQGSMIFKHQKNEDFNQYIFPNYGAAKKEITPANIFSSYIAQFKKGNWSGIRKEKDGRKRFLQWQGI